MANDDAPWGEGFTQAITGYSANVDTPLTTPSEPDTQSWGQFVTDPLHLAAAASADVAGGAMRWGGQYASPEQQSALDSYAGSMDEFSKSQRAQVSPAGQRIHEAPFFSMETLQHPLTKSTEFAGETAPYLAGGALGAAVGQPEIGGALAFGALSKAGEYTDIANGIKNTSDDVLQKNSPTYQQLRQTYPEYQAKDIYADMAHQNSSVLQEALPFLSGAVAGEFGPVGRAFGIASRGVAPSLGRYAESTVGKYGVAAAETGAANAVQAAGQAFPEQQILSQAGADAPTTGQILGSTAEAFGIGTVAGGALKRFERPAIGGENTTGNRDPREYPKLDAYVQAGTAPVSEVPAGQPDPAQAQALRSTQPELPLNQPAQPPQRQGELPLQPPSQAPTPTQERLPLQQPQQPVTQLGLPTIRGPEVMQPGEAIARPSEQAPTPYSPLPTPEPSITRVSEQPRAPEAPPPPPPPTTPPPSPTPSPGKYGPMYEKLKQAIKEETPDVTKETPSPPTPSPPTTDVTEEVKNNLKNIAIEHSPLEEGASRKAIQEHAIDIDNSITPEQKRAILALPQEEASLKSYTVFSNILANAKVPKLSDVTNFLNAEKDLHDHLDIKPEAPSTPEQPPAKPKLGFPPGFKPPEVPVTKVSEQTPRQQAAMQKLLGIKEKPTEIERPTVAPTVESKVTVIPPSDVRLQPITPSAKTLEIAAKYAPKAEGVKAISKAKELAPALKSFAGLKEAIQEKEGLPEASKISPVKKAIEDILPPKAAAAIEAGKNIAKARKSIIDKMSRASPGELAAGNYEMEHPDPADTQGIPVTVTAPGAGDTVIGRIKGTTADNIPRKPLETIHIPREGIDTRYVVNRLENGRFKSHIVVAGAKNMAEAYNNVLNRMKNEGYTIKEAENKVGGIVPMSPDEFRGWVANGDRNQAVYPAGTSHPQGILHTDFGDFPTLGSSTLHTAFKDTLNNISHMDEYKPLLPIYKWWSDNVSQHIPDVPVYYMRQNNVHDIGGKATDAFYNQGLNHIVIGNAMDTPPEIALLHEAGHAVTAHLYNGDRVYRDLVDRVHAEYKEGLADRRESPGSLNLRLQNTPRELIADWVQPKVMRQLYETPLSSELARDLKMDEWKGAPKNLWGAMVKALGDAMERLFGVRLPGGDNKYNLLDAIMRLHDKAFEAQPEAAGIGEKYRAAKDSDPTNDIIDRMRKVTHNEKDFNDSVSKHVMGMGRIASELGSNLGAKTFETGNKFLSLDENNTWNHHLFGPSGAANPLTVFTRTVQMMHDAARAIGAEKTAYEMKGFNLRRKYNSKGPWNEYISLRENSHMYNYHPDDAIGEGKNSHIKADSPTYSQTIAQYNKMKPIWDNLPQDLKDYYKEGRDIYKKDGDRLSLSKVLWAVKNVDDKQDWENVNRDNFIKQALSNGLSDKMKQWAVDKGILRSVNEATELARNPGPYFPSSREGNYYIKAKYKITAPANGDQFDENTIAFKTLHEAKAWLDTQDLKGEIIESKEPAQDAKTGEVYTPWLVKMNDQHYETAETWSKAQAIAKQIAQYTGIDKDTIRAGRKAEQGVMNYELAGPLVRRLIADADKLTNYSKDEKQRFKEMLLDTAPMSQTRGGFSAHLLKRRDVVGADHDVLTSDVVYNRGFAAHMARLEYSPQVDATLKAMEEAHARLSADGNDTNALKRDIVLNRNRGDLDNFGSARFLGTDMPPVLRDIVQLTGIRTLGSVGHVLLHPLRLAYGLARVMARYGPGAAFKVLKYQRIFGWPLGGTLEALGGAARTLGGSLDTFDASAYIRSKLAKSANAEQLLKVYDELEATGHTHGPQNVDVNLYREDTGGGGKLKQMLTRSDMAMRQVMGIGEAVNRATIGLATYEAAIAKGLSHENAVEDARNIIATSMGKFGPGERPPALSHPFMQLPLQLRGWGLSTAKALFNDLVKTGGLLGKDKEAKRAAIEGLKNLTYTFVAAGALTGFTGFLPGADILKLATRASKALGLTNSDYEDWENEVRRQGNATFGEYWGRVLAEGLPAGLGPFSFYTGGRLGLSSLFMYNLPDFEKSDSTWSAVGKLVTGATGQTVGDWAAGAKALLDGDLYGATQHIIPIKQVDDAVKAYKGATEGLPTKGGYPGMAPYGMAQAIMQLIGVTPSEVHEYQEGRFYAERALGQQHDEKMNVLDAIANAGTSGPARAKAMQQVSAYNQRNPDNQISAKDVMKAFKHATTPTIFGVPVNKRTQGTLKQMQESYGF